MAFFHRRIATWGCVLFAGLACLHSAGAATVSVIYHRTVEQSAPLSHPGAQASLQELENQLLNSQFEVIQASPDVYARMGDRAGVMLTFDRDSGFAILLDGAFETRPYVGTDMQFATAALKARVMYGTQVVAHVSKLSQVPYRAGPGESRAYAVAASKAATLLAKDIAERIQRFEQNQATTTAAPASAQPPSANVQMLPSSAPVGELSAVNNRFAVLIGVSSFKQVRKLNPQFEVSDLPAVRNDVTQMEKSLVAVGFAPANIVKLLDDQATTRSVQETLQKLQSQTKPDDLVFVYLASHGAPRNGAYTDFGIPLLYDTKVTDPNPLDFDRFKTLLKNLPARQIIWANDTCHSGGALLNEPAVTISSRSIRGLSRPGFDQAMAVQGLDKHFAVFASSRQDQVSFEVNNQGLFSGILSKAILVTQGQTGLLDLYHRHLESQVPEAARKLPCTPDGLPCPRVQQPGFAYTGSGNLLTFSAR